MQALYSLSMHDLQLCALTSCLILCTCKSRYLMIYTSHRSIPVYFTPLLPRTSPITKTPSSPFSLKLLTAASRSFLPSTMTIPTPQLNVRAISAALTPPAFINHLHIPGNSHVVQSILTPSPDSALNILGMFSMNPPPVMCDIPLKRPALIPGRSCLMYIRVGVRSASPTVDDGSQGAGDWRSSPERVTIFRMREKPLECGPEEGRARRTSPAFISERGRRCVRSTAPTAKPARS